VEFIISVEIGVYHLDVTMDGRPIFRKGDIQLDVTASDPIRARLNFEMEGQGLYGGRVGEHAEFSLIVKDDYGKLVGIEAAGLQLILQGPTTLYGKIGVEGPGRYQASFVVSQAGEYDIDVIYDKNKVLEKNRVKFSNRTDPSRSVVSNVPERVRSNTDVHFTITSKDSRGGPIHIGGDNWEATANGPERVNKLQIQDHDNGQYTVTTLLPLQGVYSFEVRCAGIVASNSPVKIRVD